MKKIHLFSLALVAVSLLSFVGCRTNYLVETRFNPNLSGTRTIFRSDTNFYFTPDAHWEKITPKAPFAVDFYDCIDTMRQARQQTFAYLLPLPKDSTGNPVWQPKEKMVKKFRWFYTYYDYTVQYSKITDTPLPLSDYLTPEQQQVLLRGEKVPKNWNGMEMYSQLDDLNTAFVRWQSACQFQILFSGFHAFANREQQQMLDAYHDSLCHKFEKMSDISKDDFLACTDTIEDLQFCRRLYDANQQDIILLCNKKGAMFEYITDAVLHRVYLPGTIVNCVGCTLDDSNCSYKVDVFRLLAGDLSVAATSRTVNTWAFLFTAFVLVVIGVFVFRRPKRVRKNQ